MSKIYGVTLNNQMFEGEEIVTDSQFLRSITTTAGDEIVIPWSYNVYDTAEERNISIFRKKRNQLSLAEVALKYNITIEEATTAYDLALERFPEKFI